MHIQPQLLTLQKLLAGRLFRIPQYQRAYSWTSAERSDLFADIEKTAGAQDRPHFMATIVGLRRETRTIQTDEFSVVDVVDGQQRLTTLIILIRAIERALKSEDPAEKKLKDELEGLLVKADELSLVLLQTNHDSSDFCINYLRSGTHPAVSVATTAADRRVLEAMSECESFVARWLASGKSPMDLLALLKNRFLFILHEIEDEAIVYSVFEVLNSRGLAVSWFDRLKSVLMGVAFEADTGNSKETIDELHTIWQDIYATIGLREDLSTEALRVAATLRAPQQPSKPLGERDAVDVLRESTKNTAKGAIDVSKWIRKVTIEVDRLHGDNRRNGVTEIGQARLLAAAIMLRDDLAEGERETLLDAWEKVSFRIYGMLDYDARTKVGDYVRLAWQCERKRPKAEKLLESVTALGERFPIDEAIEALRDADCYQGWQTSLRYLLFRYEEHLAKQRGQAFNNEQWNRIWADTAARSIEHIHPQSAGEDESTPDGVFVHRLGNLTLLPPGLNSKLKDRAPEDKREEYYKTGLAVAADVADRIPIWDRKAIETREEEILTWAKSEWG